MKRMILIFMFFQVSLGKWIYAQSFDHSNLPIIIINTNGATIPDEPKIIANMGIIDNGIGKINKITDKYNNYNGKIGIEVRGSTSQQFPKKQYAVSLWDSTGNEIEQSLLGLPSESDWILFAPYNDKTLIRDALMYKLSNEIGRYASRSRFCELILNQNYMGVYVLFEKIKRNKNRVPISKLTAADSTGDAITGGYIFKVDKDDSNTEPYNTSNYPPYNNAWQTVKYFYHYPNSDNITAKQKKYLKEFISTFENKMMSGNYTDPQTGYYNTVNFDSFVDNFLLNELAKNVDAYKLSSYFFKDKDSKDTRINAGPIWDFNLSLGNCNYYRGWLTDGWHLKFTFEDSKSLQDPFLPPFWSKKIFDDPKFLKRAAEKWNILKINTLNTNHIFHTIDSLTTLLDTAKTRNFVKWPVLSTYVWPNYYVGGNYQNEITYLKNFISGRINWMNNTLATYISIEKDKNSGEIKDFELLQNYPNPFNPSTEISYRLSVVSNVKLQIYDVLGKEVKTLVNERQNAGIYKVKFDAENLSSGIYIAKLQTDGNSKNIKMLLMK